MRGWLDKGVYYKKEKESSVLRFADAWTINLSELSSIMPQIKYFVYITPSTTYWISREKAIEKGFTRNHKGEMKLCVPRKYWEIGEFKALDLIEVSR